jgi:hypothetical protein
MREEQAMRNFIAKEVSSRSNVVKLKARIKNTNEMINPLNRASLLVVDD